MTEIEVELSAKSVSDAVDALRAYADNLVRAADECAGMLADYGVEAARKGVKDGDPWLSRNPGELRESIHAERNGDGSYTVATACDHAAFVEFGTGVVGQRSGYWGELPAGWDYNSGSCIDEDGYWWFLSADGKTRVWTQGQPGRGYMAAAAEELKMVAPEYLRMVIGS